MFNLFFESRENKSSDESFFSGTWESPVKSEYVAKNQSKEQKLAGDSVAEGLFFYSSMMESSKKSYFCQDLIWRASRTHALHRRHSLTVCPSLEQKESPSCAVELVVFLFCGLLCDQLLFERSSALARTNGCPCGTGMRLAWVWIHSDFFLN